MKMQELKFGVEIELVQIERGAAAKVIQRIVGGAVCHVGGGYDTWECRSADGRIWKTVSDASLNDVSSNLRCEVVSPILTYADIETLQQIIRSLRRAGAVASQTCGIHCHVDKSVFNVKALINLVKIVYKEEELLIRALGISDSRLERYTQRTELELVRRIQREKPRNIVELNKVWYGYYNANPYHYDNTRYHILNLHPVFSGQTVEIRAFESTLHAGKVKAYIQLVLAIASKAINAKAACSRKRDFNASSAKYDLRVWLLGLGMIGDEFKTARLHLLANMPGDAAWKNPEQRRARRAA